ncbi:MAG TPA: MoaD/ThiS family protein [Pseudonocardiaceae bacterium]|jgi:molybdopterin converting factor small subunit|nr:MoaD/ThiS family protein [Pseudonocardiaceae bacterium]
MRVTVLLAGVLRPAASGAARLDIRVDDGTVGAVLDVLADRFPLLDRKLRDERRVLRRYVNIYVDGEECRRLAGADTVVVDGTEIQVIPSVAGG